MNAPHPHSAVERFLIPPAPPATPAEPMLLAATAWRATLHPTQQPSPWLLPGTVAALAAALLFFGAVLAQAVAR